MLPDSSSLISPKRFFLRVGDADPEKTTLVDALGAFLMLVDVLIYNDDSFVINGQELIVDFEGTDYAYAAQFTPMYMKKAVNLLQDAYPCRIKACYLINVPSFLQVAINFIVSFLTEKLKKRVSRIIYLNIPLYLYECNYTTRTFRFIYIQRII